MRRIVSSSALVVVSSLLCAAANVGAQPLIRTVVGNGPAAGAPASSVGLGNVRAVTTDAAGNMYIASVTPHRVYRINPAGLLTVVAGSGPEGFSGDDGPATAAMLAWPSGLTVDASGDLYIADTLNHRIRRVSQGIITTVVGSGAQGFSGDGGLARSAALNSPLDVAIDGVGTLYLADRTNHRIRAVTDGIITTVAGSTFGFGGDGGPATAASLNNPFGVEIDGSGNLYIADTGNHRVRFVSAGIISTVAGNGTATFSGDGGAATSAGLNSPVSMALGPMGSVHIADQGNRRVRRISGGIITTTAGNGTLDFTPDGMPATGGVQGLWGIAAHGDTLYVAEAISRRIRAINGSGTLATAAGDGSLAFSGDGGPGIDATIAFPGGLAIDPSGAMLIVDSGNQRIRKVADGTITTIAGNGETGFAGDGGPALNARLNFPDAVTVDGAGNVFVADTENHRVRMISGGTITTVAGNGSAGFSGDGGPATSASLNRPNGVAADAAGNVYIAEAFNCRVRRVSAGIITTFAGTGSCAFSGDGGPPSSAGVRPQDVAVASNGDVYIVDGLRIRRVSAGTIETVAGNGTSGTGGDGGSATSASLNSPRAVAVDADGSFYIGDNSHRVRKVSGGVINTVAGTAGIAGFSGDGGPATAARLNLPHSLAVSDGVLYIADLGNHRVRAVSEPQPPVISWSTPADIIVGTPLGPSQLNATASFDGSPVPGTFTYTPEAGTVLPVGSGQMLSVSFQPDDGFRFTIATANVSIDVLPVATSALLFAAPTTAGFLQPVYLVASVSVVPPHTGVPGGIVQFLDGSTPLGTALLSGGYALLVAAGLAPGVHSISAVYLGAGDFAGAAAAPVNITVQSAAQSTFTFVFPATNPQAAGQAAVFAAIVQPIGGGGPATGSVQFLNGSTVIGTAALSNGVAVFSTSALPAGIHVLSARYPGNGTLARSTSPVALQTIYAGARPISSSVALTMAPNPTAAGETTTMTATVTPASGTPTGTVYFLSDGVVVGTAPVSNAGGVFRATLPVSTLSTGVHVVVALFVGGSGFSTANSLPVFHVVQPAVAAGTR